MKERVLDDVVFIHVLPDAVELLFRTIHLNRQRLEALDGQQVLPLVDQIEYGGAVGECFESPAGESQRQTEDLENKR